MKESEAAECRRPRPGREVGGGQSKDPQAPVDPCSNRRPFKATKEGHNMGGMAVSKRVLYPWEAPECP